MVNNCLHVLNMIFSQFKSVPTSSNRSPVQFSSNSFGPVFCGFFAVSVRFFGSYLNRQPVAVAVASKKGKKPDWTGLLNTMYA